MNEISARLGYHRERLDTLRVERTAADATGDPRAALDARRNLLRALVREHFAGGGFRDTLRVLHGLDAFLDSQADTLGPAGVDDLIRVFDDTTDPDERRAA